MDYMIEIGYTALTAVGYAIGVRVRAIPATTSRSLELTRHHSHHLIKRCPASHVNY